MRRKLLIAAAILAIPALAVAWWLGSPLFLDTEVDEEFPMAAGAEIPDDMTIEEVEATMVEAAAQPDTITTEPMPDKEGEEEATETTVPAPTGPVVLRTATFAGADDSHQGSGTATIYELEDGSRVLRFEDFEVTNGPDLHVILTPATEVSGREDVTAAGYIDLGSLKGNIGSQNYEIPDDVDLDEYGTVVIYCVPFHVVFATATLN